MFPWTVIWSNTSVRSHTLRPSYRYVMNVSATSNVVWSSMYLSMWLSGDTSCLLFWICVLCHIAGIVLVLVCIYKLSRCVVFHAPRHVVIARRVLLPAKHPFAAYCHTGRSCSSPLFYLSVRGFNSIKCVRFSRFRHILYHLYSSVTVKHFTGVCYAVECRVTLTTKCS